MSLSSFPIPPCGPRIMSQPEAARDRTESLFTWSALKPTVSTAGMCPRVGLLLLHVDCVLLVFVAEHFEDVGVGFEIVADLDGKRLGVHLGVVEGRFHVQVSEVAAVETFRDAQRFAMRVAQGIERGLIVEARGFHHQYVALPTPCRVAQEGRKLEFL